MPRPALGLYFTDHHLEISQLSSDGTRLLRFNEIPLNPGVIENGEIKNPTLFSQALIQLLKTAKPQPISANEEVVIGISDNRVFLREFTLPKYAGVGKGIEDAIEYQIRSILPVLPPNVVTDWQIIGRDPNDQIEVLLVAIPKNIIDSYLAATEAVGLKVIAVEPAVFANIRVIRPELVQNKNQLLVYAGTGYTEFTFITSGKPRFSDFLSNQEVEKKGPIINAIRDYAAFSNTKHPGRPIQEILVSGHDSRAESIVATLAAQRVAVIMAVSRLAETPQSDHTLLRTSHGLSLKPTDTPPSLNLLPLPSRLEVIRRRLIFRWAAVINLLIVLTLLLSLGLYFFYQNLLAAESVQSQLKTQYEQELKESANQAIIATADNLNNITDRLVLLRETTGNENGLLRQLSFVTPPGITLTSFTYTRGGTAKKLADPNSAWSITGTASERSLVLSFYANLIKQPNFQNGRLYFGSLEKEAGVDFRIASSQARQ